MFLHVPLCIHHSKILDNTATMPFDASQELNQIARQLWVWAKQCKLEVYKNSLFFDSSNVTQPGWLF